MKRWIAGVATAVLASASLSAQAAPARDLQPCAMADVTRVTDCLAAGGDRDAPDEAFVDRMPRRWGLVMPVDTDGVGAGEPPAGDSATFSDAVARAARDDARPRPTAAWRDNPAAGVLRHSLWADLNVPAVSEPHVYALMVAGVFAVGVARRRPAR